MRSHSVAGVAERAERDGAKVAFSDEVLLWLCRSPWADSPPRSLLLTGTRRVIFGDTAPNALMWALQLTRDQFFSFELGFRATRCMTTSTVANRRLAPVTAD